MLNRLPRFAVVFGTILGLARCSLAAEPSSQPAADVVQMYLRAAEMIKVDSPSASNAIFPEWPPFDPAWQKMAKDAFDANKPARELVHEAWFVNRADWGAVQNPSPLNTARKVANDVLDAALYQHTQGDNAGAIQGIEDMIHLCALLEANGKANAVQRLVSGGIYARIANDILVIASAAPLTDKPDNARDIQLSAARTLIAQLLDQIDPNVTPPPVGIDAASAARFVETLNRINSDRSFAAMSLAAQLYRFDKHHWPATGDELVPDYLPTLPFDPWGDGQQRLGYVLIKAGLPDGSDRPLVYSRCESKDGLMYRIDAPQYGFYEGDGSGAAVNLQKHVGQFRDLARWTAPARPAGAPTVAPLP